ncbi:radical SAM protein [Nonomuraea sp. MG754425]|uniref:B12-binding domain-containing radical SAM protein n=1 Tax=Nonomuraea sp. MG754425 TaxID=2570319 RepID=UPI001EEDA57F|nr:cobalamin-dependent protein [Nonomuraea sp. MG754425]MCF6470541.1 radical SAM protein [Nonomuraea sp. MG754425]
MKVRNVLLVNAGSDEGIASIANDGTFPALGVVSLATVLRRDHPDVEVIAVDGQITPMDEVEKLIADFEPDVLGVGVLATSYGNALRLAELGKEAGAVTVFGNDQATAMAEQILRHRAAVDYVCAADVGEFSLSALVSALDGERPIESVPELLYRTSGGIAHNRLPEIPPEEIKGSGGALRTMVLDAIPVPDRTLMPDLNWSRYLDNYLNRYGELHAGEDITGVTTMNRARGCARVKSPCHFCGIMDLSLRFSSPEIFWHDVRAAQEQMSASIFYEAFDSMSSSPRWVQAVVEARPDDIGEAKFFVYTQAAETTPRLVELYRRLGVYRVNMGLEAGDTGMLKVLKGPRDSLENNQRACRLFKEAGMLIHGSLVLGGPGETSQSLDNTVRFARWLIDNEMMASLEAQPLFPDFGALTGKWLMNPDLARQVAKERGFEILDGELLDLMPSKYGSTDMVDFDEVSKDWSKIFSHAPWDELIDATHTIRSYADRSGTITGSGRITQATLGSA